MLESENTITSLDNFSLFKDNLYLAKELKKTKVLLKKEKEISGDKEKEILLHYDKSIQILNEYKNMQTKYEKALLVVSKKDEENIQLKEKIIKTQEILEDRKNMLTKTKESLDDLKLTHNLLKQEYSHLKNDHANTMNQYQNLKNSKPVKLIQKYWSFKKRLREVFKR